MSFSTFSGPIRSGTIREGATRNTGLVELVQTYDPGDRAGVIVSNVDAAAFIIPKGSIITDIVIDATTAFTVATVNVSVGTTSGGAELMAAVAVTAGGRFRGVTTAATQLAWQVSTSADVTIYVRTAVTVGTIGAGRFIATVKYMQRSDAGLANPTSV